MNILLTICARGGSKGVKNKNIRHLMGKPLIAYTINQALLWSKAGRIVVSTDSEDIASVARTFGAETPFVRPAELATDTAAKVPVIRHAARHCEELYGERYDLVVDLDPTAPVRTIADLDACLEIFMAHRPKTIFSVVAAHKNPYFNMVELNEAGFAHLSKALPQGVSTRQSAPRVYAMNASIYFYDRQYLMDETVTSPISDSSMVHVMDDLAGQDIDREIDFEFIEFLCQRGKIKLD